MLFRGTTPYHTFLLPMAAEDVDTIYITYSQNGQIIVEKTNSDITLTNVEQDLSEFITDINMGDSFSSNDLNPPAEEISYCNANVHLTQEDTLGFKFYPAAEKNIAIIQIRVFGTDGEAYASDPIRERIYGVTKDGVIPTQEENVNEQQG